MPVSRHTPGVNFPGYQPLERANFSLSDQSSLNSLAVCHFAYAVLLALGGLIPLGGVLFGIGLVSSLTAAHARGAGGFIMGGAFLIVLGALAALLWVKAALVFFSGLGLRRGKHRMLSQVVACLCCLNMPLGTLLGVFTLMVLARPSVRAGYELNTRL
jgi:hypothetical protein